MFFLSSVQQATGAVYASRPAGRRPSEGPGDLRHHLQVHGHQPPGCRAVHLLCRPVSPAGQCRVKCPLPAAHRVRDAFCAAGTEAAARTQWFSLRYRNSGKKKRLFKKCVKLRPSKPSEEKARVFNKLDTGVYY